MANEAQLYLLVDHIKFVLLELQNASKGSSDIPSLAEEASRSLSSLKSSLDKLGTAVSIASSQDATNLQQQYQQLYQQSLNYSHSSRDVHDSYRSYKDQPELSVKDTQSDALQSSSILKEGSLNSRDAFKSVRFSDALSDDDLNRDALLSYQDDPEFVPDQSNLGNRQTHAHHSRVMDIQDRQLDELSQSVIRQRELSIQIGSELNGQAEILDQIDDFTSRHQTQLNRAQSRLRKVARHAKDNLQMTTIVILVVILLLLMLVLKR